MTSILDRINQIMEDAQKKHDEEMEELKSHVLVGYTEPMPEFINKFASVMLSAVNESATMDYKKYTALFLEYAEKLLNETEKGVIASWSHEGMKYMLMPAITAAEKMKVDPEVFYSQLFTLMKAEIHTRMNAV